MKQGIPFLLLLILVCSVPAALASDDTVSTLWPFFDYRASEAADYSSLHMFGPFVKYETKRTETEYALRPLFYRAVDEEGVSSTDVLYPVLRYKNQGDGTSSVRVLGLLSYDFGESEDDRPGDGDENSEVEAFTSKRYYLFPFLFYGEEEQGRYFAFFPFFGTLYNWFKRDRISFTLFPIYSQTERKGTQVDNIIWPFFAKISGENESGYKFWPIYGASQKEGVYRKRFFLWPVFFSESLKLDSDNPKEVRAAWPFYVSKESPERSSTTVLWPFFSKVEDRVRDFEVWNAPWPLVRVTKGEKYHGLKILPFFSDETVDVKRERWYVWPVYKIEEMNTELIERRRDRILFFLYSDTKERKFLTGDSTRLVNLWPLYGYRETNGVSHFYVFSLIEPFFPRNESIERLWAPLWRIYQHKWDQQGNHVVSLLWNLYWHERQGDRVAWELFPLFQYRRESPAETDFKFLKGLFHYRASDQGKQLNLFYLPWGVRWGAPVAATE